MHLIVIHYYFYMQFITLYVSLMWSYQKSAALQQVIHNLSTTKMRQQNLPELLPIPKPSPHKQKPPQLHIENPQGFRNLVRLNLLPNYDYAKVFQGLSVFVPPGPAVCVAYAVKYALDWGLFRLPHIDIEKVTNPDVRYLLQKIINFQHYQNPKPQLPSPQSSLTSPHQVQSQLSSVSITLQKQLNISNNYNEQNQRTVIKIRCMKQVIKEDKIEEENEEDDQGRDDGYKGNFWFWNSYFKRFEEYLEKSANQKIHKGDMAGDILNGLSWRVSNSSLSLVSTCLLDNLVLKYMCIEIVYNQINIHSCSVSEQIFKSLLDQVLYLEDHYKQCWRQVQTTSYQTSRQRLIGAHSPPKNSLKYYTDNSIYRKLGVDSLMKSLLQVHGRWQRKYEHLWFWQRDYHQEREDLANMMYPVILKDIQSYRFKCAKMVSELLLLKPDNYGKMISKDTFEKLENMDNNRLKKQLWNVFLLFSKPIEDYETFITQYKKSVTIPTTQKSKIQSRTSKNYVLAVLANGNLTQKFFTQTFIKQMFQLLLNQSQTTNKNIRINIDNVQLFLDVLIKKHQKKSLFIVGMITDLYFWGTDSRRAVYLETWIIRIAELATDQGCLKGFVVGFAQKQLKAPQKGKMAFWLLLMHRILTRFRSVSMRTYTKDVEQYWKKCIISSQPLQTEHKNFQISAQSTQGQLEQKITNSLFTSQILKDYKQIISPQILWYYLQKYLQLEPAVRANALEIFELFLDYTAREASPQKIEKLFTGLLELIQSQEEFGRNMGLKELMYLAYDKIRVNSIKEAYYPIIIDLVGFYEPKSQTNKDKVFNLNNSILKMIPETKSKNQERELQILGRMLNEQSLTKLHRLAYQKLAKKLHHEICPPNNLISTVEQYISKQFGVAQPGMMISYLELAFKMPAQLSRSFIRSCFQYVNQNQTKTQNQFLLMIIKSSFQQLQTPLFNLVMQKQIVMKNSNNSEITFHNLQLINRNMSLLDEKYVPLLFKFSVRIFHYKEGNLNLIWKILQIVEQLKDTKLYNLTEKSIGEIFMNMRTIDNSRFYQFLLRKCEVMGQLNSFTISHTIHAADKNTDSVQLMFLIAEILLKYPKTQYSFPIIWEKFRQLVFENGSQQFTKALISYIKCRQSNIFAIDKEDEGIFAYLREALKVERPTHVVCSIDLLEILWKQIQDVGYYIDELLRIIKKFSTNSIVKQRYKSFINQEKVQKKVQSLLKDMSKWQALKFYTMNHEQKRQFAVLMIRNGTKNTSAYLEYVDKFVQTQRLSRQQLNSILKTIELVSEGNGLGRLLENIVLYQTSCQIDQSQAVNLINLTLTKLKQMKGCSKLEELLENFAVKTYVNFPVLRAQLANQFNFLQSISQLARQNPKQKIIRHTNLQICCLFVDRFSFLLATDNAFFPQLLSNLLSQVYHSREQLPIQIIDSFISKALSVPTIDSSDINLINLIQHLIQKGSHTPKIIEHYNLYLTLYDITQESGSKLQSIYLSVCENIYKCPMQFLAVLPQIIKLKEIQEAKQKLNKDDSQTVAKLKILAESGNPRIAPMAWKCIFTICRYNNEAYSKLAYEIQFMKTRVTNKRLTDKFNNLIMLSGCEVLPDCQTVTQILLMNFIKKYEMLLKGRKLFQQTSFGEGVEKIREQSHFLIDREKYGEDSQLDQNQFFIRNLEKLFTKKMLIFEDLLIILELAQANFQKVTEQLTKFGEKIFTLIPLRELETKRIQVLKPIKFIDCLSLANCLNIVELIGSQRDLEEFEKVMGFLSTKIENFNQIYCGDYPVSSFDDFKISIVIQGLLESVPCQQRTNKLSLLVRKLTCKAMKTEEFYEQIFQKIQQILRQNWKKPQFVDSLQTFYDYIAENHEITLLNLQFLSESSEFINKKYIQMAGKSHEKDISQILQELKLNKVLSQEQILGLNQFLAKTEESNRKDLKQPERSLDKIQPPESQTDYLIKINSFGEKIPELFNFVQKIKFSKSKFFTQDNCNLMNEIAYYEKKVKQCKGIQKNLRNTQKIAIWIGLNSILNNKKSNILQVGTGQGKSLIIVGIAAILARRKSRVDIITSSPVLAERDKQEFKKLFKMMGISCDCNIEKVAYQEGEKKCYKYQIVYGTCIQFSFDWLRHHYCRLNTKGNREETNNYLIIDEADNCMIDDMFYVARLADSFPGAECLLPLYYQIWNTFQELIKRLIQIENKLYLVKGLISYEGSIISLNYAEDQNKTPVFINDLRQEILDWLSEGEDIKSLPFILDEIDESRHVEFVKVQMEERINLMLSLPQYDFVWSSYARQYAKNHVNLWSESLIIAEKMTENADYIITKSNTIKLVDYMKTGVVQTNTSLSHAVHQFLQCKHRCPLTLQTRTTNYLSYYSLFQMYPNRIIGLTGTVGGQKSRQVFKDVYQTSCSIIPKFMKDMMFKLPSLSYQDPKQWHNGVIQHAILQAKKGRSVLIVCLTIGIGNKIAAQIQKRYKSELVTKYFSNDEKGQGGDEEPKTCQKGEIIIATNLAGRGTDIKTEEAVELCGGLHVILTYIPDSQRVEMQIMGRTCRNGKLGSFQRITCDQQKQADQDATNDSTNDKNTNCEKKQAKTNQQMIQEIKLKDDLFRRFNEWLISVRGKQKLGFFNSKFEYCRTLHDVVICEIEDRFSELINQIEKMMSQNHKLEAIRIKYEQKLSQIRDAYGRYKSQGLTRSNFIRNGCYLLRLANAYTQSHSQSWAALDNPEELKDLLSAAEKVDPNNFNVYYLQAYYYLRGKRCWFTKNNHTENYKSGASQLLQKSKKLLLEQMSGYESIIQHLIQKNEQMGRMYKQFEKKLEICTECLQSIDRMLDTIKLSYCPVQLKVFGQNGEVCQVYQSIQREEAEKIIDQSKGRSQIKSLKMQQDSLQSLLGEQAYDIRLSVEGELGSAINFINDIRSSEAQFGIKQLKGRIEDISIPTIQTLFQFISKRPNHEKPFDLTIQFSESSIENSASFEKVKKTQARNLKTNMRKNQDKPYKQFSMSIKQDKAVFEVLSLLKKDSAIRVIHQASSLAYFSLILSVYGKNLQAKSCAIQLTDSRLKKQQVIEKYTEFAQKHKLQCKPVMHCLNRQKGVASMRILNKKLQKDEKNLDVSKTKKLSELYSQTNSPVLEIAQMYNRGFELIFEIQNRKPFPYKAVFILGAVALGQIILGSALMITGAGFTLGSAILCQSLNQIFAIVDVCRTNQFSVKSYLIGKAISLTITAVTLGFGALKNAGKGIQQVGTVLTKQIAQQGCVTAISNMGKSLLSKQTKQMMTLVGKKLLIEAGEQIATRVVSQGLNQVSDLAVEQLQRTIENQIHNMLDADDLAVQELKKLRLIQSYQYSISHKNEKLHRVYLKEEVSKIFAPDPKCPYITQIISGLKSIAVKLIQKSKSGGSLCNAVVQTANILSLVKLMYTKIMEPLGLMKKLLNRKVFHIVYPEAAIQVYLQTKKQLSLTQKNLIIEQARSKNKEKEEQVRLVAQQQNNVSWHEKIGAQILGEDLPEIKDYGKNSKMLIVEQKVSHLDALLLTDIKSMGKEDLQLVEKVMVDFVMQQIKSNIKSKVVSVFITPFVNKYLTKPFVRKHLNKALASKNQHNEQDRLRYQKIKNQKVKSKGDQEFMKQFQNPNIDKQLNSHCRYRSSAMTSRYNQIMLEKKREKASEQDRQSVCSKLEELKSKKTPVLNEAQIKMVAKKLGLNIKITRDPNCKLSQKQIADGVQLMLYEQGNYDQKGNINIGHYKIYDPRTQSFNNVQQQSLTSCSMDILKHLAKEQGHNIRNNDDIKNILIAEIEQNPQNYKKCEQAYKFLQTQYPEYSNSLMMIGGFNRELAEKKREEFYAEGDVNGHGYNCQIYEESNMKYVKDKLEKFLGKDLSQVDEKELDGIIRQFMAQEDPSERLFSVPDNWRSDVCRNGSMVPKMSLMQKIEFIDKQLKNVDKIISYQRKYPELACSTDTSQVPETEFQKFQKCCRETYNTCCRHFATSLNYLYTKDPNFTGVLQKGDKVLKVTAPGHAYLAIIDINTNTQYINDPTVPLNKHTPYGTWPYDEKDINNKIERLHQASNNLPKQQFHKFVSQDTRYSESDVNYVDQRFQGDLSKVASQFGYLSYRPDNVLEIAVESYEVKIVETQTIVDGTVIKSQKIEKVDKKYEVIQQQNEQDQQ